MEGGVASAATAAKVLAQEADRPLGDVQAMVENLRWQHPPLHSAAKQRGQPLPPAAAHVQKGQPISGRARPTLRTLRTLRSPEPHEEAQEPLRQFVGGCLRGAAASHREPCGSRGPKKLDQAANPNEVTRSAVVEGRVDRSYQPQ